MDHVPLDYIPIQRVYTLHIHINWLLYNSGTMFKVPIEKWITGFAEYVIWLEIWLNVQKTPFSKSQTHEIFIKLLTAYYRQSKSGILKEVLSKATMSATNTAKNSVR